MYIAYDTAATSTAKVERVTIVAILIDLFEIFRCLDGCINASNNVVHTKYSIKEGKEYLKDENASTTLSDTKLV